MTFLPARSVLESQVIMLWASEVVSQANLPGEEGLSIWFSAFQLFLNILCDSSIWFFTLFLTLCRV